MAISLLKKLKILQVLINNLICRIIFKNTSKNTYFMEMTLCYHLQN